MKKSNFLKILALTVCTLIAFSLGGCNFISGIIGGTTGGIEGGGDETPVLTLSQTELSLAVNQNVQLTAYTNNGAAVSWGTLNSNIATVEGGLVTGVSEGETVVWAETSALMATCTVTVSGGQAEGTLTLSQTTLNMEVGSSATLTANCSVAGATIKWSSALAGVATVANGKVTAVSKGYTVITAKAELPTGGTLSATCVVTVTEPAGASKPGYNLVWCDEFDGASLDTSKWGYQTGTQDKYSDSPTYWGNNEQQYYTQDAVAVENGALKITATKRKMGDRSYTSGRILTRDKAYWTYGYFEAKMKTPTGNGMWPAFWMLPQPTNSNVSSGNAYGTWPLNGEIDIMEAKGRLNNVTDHTIHFGSMWPANQYRTGNYTLTGSTTAEWHTYAVDWTSQAITWYVDGVQAFKLTNNLWYTDGSSAASAPFDKDFYILFNLAVGGNYDGGVAPDDASFTSATMEVDYVRVYKKA